jgi:hypothetical protein
MKVFYAQEEVPNIDAFSVFLVGPTPRKEGVQSWRPEMIRHLTEMHFKGVVYSPEPRDGKWLGNWDHQVQWEKKHLDSCNVIIAWVARSLPDMPAFTTNVEFGRYVGSGKMVYGRPCWAEKVGYLDWLYKEVTTHEPYDNMRDIAEDVVRSAHGWERVRKAILTHDDELFKIESVK